MVSMITFIATFLIIGMIFVGSTGVNLVLNSRRIKKHSVQADRPKQLHLHDVIFARHN